MNKRGFTLVEIIMVITIVGIVLPGIMYYFIEGVRGSADAQRRTTAVFLAQGLMEEIRSKRWDETATGIAADCSNASLVLGPDAEGRAAYDDIDDFHGLSNTPPLNSQGASMDNYPGFSQGVNIIYVNAADLESPAAGRTCYKRISVTIDDPARNEMVQLVSLMSAYGSH